MLDSENDEKREEWLTVDSTLGNLTRELDRLRSQHTAGNKTIQNELEEQLTKFEIDLKAKAEATLDIVGRSDQTYLEEISTLKDELKKIAADRQKMLDLLESNKKNEKAMNLEMKTLKEKINVFENVEDKGPWFDIEQGGPMDLDRITKALSKSTQLINVLQSKIERLSSAPK
jgi:seryl-tRNA synthetase